MRDQIIKDEIKIDILINNACEVVLGTCETCTISEQQRAMDVNYFGPIRMLQKILPHMRLKKSGHIINISSVAGFETFPLIETYVATKFALEGISESLATYLHNWNIKVTIVEPAGINTRVAFHSNQGSRNIKETECFKKICGNAHEIMKINTPECQNPDEISELIMKIINDPNPDLRYQTNQISSQMAKNHFVDPTGNARLVNKKKIFMFQ